MTPSAPLPPLPSPRQLAWLLVQAPEERDEAQTAGLARIVQDEEVAGVAELGHRLAALVRSCGTGRDPPPVEPLRTFGPGWRRPVPAASRPWRASPPPFSRR